MYNVAGAACADSSAAGSKSTATCFLRRYNSISPAALAIRQVDVLVFLDMFFLSFRSRADLAVRRCTMYGEHFLFANKDAKKP